jgi:hypothetical protein
MKLFVLIGMSRRIILATLSVVALLGGATPSVGQQTWVEYRSATGGYRVEFPDTPKVVPMDVQTKDVPQVVFVEFGDLYFVSAFAELNGVQAYPQEYLDRARDGTVAYGKGTLRTSQQLTVGGLPARRFVYELPDKRIVVHMTVLSDKGLYQLEGFAPSGKENSAEIRHFIDSFAIVAR